MVLKIPKCLTVSKTLNRYIKKAMTDKDAGKIKCFLRFISDLLFSYRFDQIIKLQTCTIKILAIRYQYADSIIVISGA